MSGRRPIIVTGATGFVGRHLVPRLLADGFALRLAVRPGVALPSEWRRAAIQMVEIPDLATADLRFLAEGGLAVVHLAGLAHLTGTAARNESAFTQANVDTTRQLTEAVRAAGVPRFIFLSTLATITSNATKAVVDDCTDVSPTTPYGQSKRAAEALVDTLAKTGCAAISLRPPLIVGADARGNWRSLQALAASGLPLPFASLTAQRSFVSVQTIAEAISLLCGTEWQAGLSGKYCIADPEPLTLPAVIAALRSGMGLSPRLSPFPPALLRLAGNLAGRRQQIAGLIGALRVDPGRFLTTFGFTPSLALRDAIRLSGTDYLSQTRNTD